MNINNNDLYLIYKFLNTEELTNENIALYDKITQNKKLLQIYINLIQDISIIIYDSNNASLPIKIQETEKKFKTVSTNFNINIYKNSATIYSSINKLNLEVRAQEQIKRKNDNNINSKIFNFDINPNKILNIKYIYNYNFMLIKFYKKTSSNSALQSFSETVKIFYKSNTNNILLCKINNQCLDKIRLIHKNYMIYLGSDLIFNIILNN